MSYVRIWVHLVFTTKDREAIFTSELRKRLIDHIKTNARSKDIFIEAISGWSEHLHLLISLGREQNISKIAMKYGTPATLAARQLLTSYNLLSP